MQVIAAGAADIALVAQIRAGFDELADLQLGLAAGRTLAHVGVFGPFAVGVFDPDVVVLLVGDGQAAAVDALVEAVDDVAHEAVGRGHDLVRAAAAATHVDAPGRAVILVIVADFDFGAVGVRDAVDALGSVQRESGAAQQHRSGDRAERVAVADRKHGGFQHDGVLESVDESGVALPVSRALHAGSSR